MDGNIKMLKGWKKPYLFRLTITMKHPENLESQRPTQLNNVDELSGLMQELKLLRGK